MSLKSQSKNLTWANSKKQLSVVYVMLEKSEFSTIRCLIERLSNIDFIYHFENKHKIKLELYDYYFQVDQLEGLHIPMALNIDAVVITGNHFLQVRDVNPLVLEANQRNVINSKWFENMAHNIRICLLMSIIMNKFICIELFLI